MDSSPHPYALPRPIPSTIFARSRSGSVMVAVPSNRVRLWRIRCCAAGPLLPRWARMESSGSEVRVAGRSPQVSAWRVHHSSAAAPPSATTAGRP
jgi:hypothetical protein